MDLPASIGTPSSILTDEDIKQAVDAGFLIEKDDFDPDNIKYASYELTIGDYLLELGLDDAGNPTTTKKKSNQGVVEIWPRQTARVFTHERLSIPNNVLGRVTVIGQLFGSGLSASNTFADPGFSDHLYLTLHNISPRVVQLSVGHPLARIEFHKLGKAVKSPHKSRPRSNLFVIGKKEADCLDDPAVSLSDLKDHIVNCKAGSPCLKHLKVLEGVIERVANAEQKQDLTRLLVILILAFLSFLLIFLLYDSLPKLITNNIKKEFVGVVSSIVIMALALLKREIRDTAFSLIRRMPEQKAKE